MERFYTVSELGHDTFNSVNAAIQGWVNAGRPKSDGNSVWVTEHRAEPSGYVGTVRTLTIAA